MRKRRVVVTGIGAFTPIGAGAAGLWTGLLAAKPGIRRLTRFDPAPFRSQMAGEINDFDPLDHMDARMARKLDRFAQLGMAASRQAVNDACLNGCYREPPRLGVSIGSALGGVAYGETQHEAFLDRGLRAVGTNLATAVYGGASGANIAIDLDFRGPNLSNANSCASGAVAIGEAMRVIQRDEADLMLAGGVEAPLAPLTYGAFSLIKAMSKRNDEPETASRPFDADRDGFVMGEGAALLVLEEEGHAIRRNARIYGEVRGYAQTNDAYHMTAPRPDGREAARSISAALADSGISVGDIDYVNAHATGTPLGDVAEARALKLAFQHHCETVPVSGTKGLYGHPLGASGGIEAVITVLALSRQFLPGTANLRVQDPECSLNLVPSEGREASLSTAISTSFGFGGVNATLVLGQARHGQR